MRKKKLVIGFLIATGIFLQGIRTQAEIFIPLPDRKPLSAENTVNSPSGDHGFLQWASFGLDKIRPLSNRDEELYSQIFSLQAVGKIAESDSLIETLRDDRLMGHVLYQRYMHPKAYISTFGELQEWMAKYADHPGADKIYAMAMAKKPAGYKGTIKKPDAYKEILKVREPSVDQAKSYDSTINRNAWQQKDVLILKNEIMSKVKSSAPSAALTLLKNSNLKELLDSTERDILKSRIAQSYFYNGEFAKAHDLAQEAAQRSGNKAPIASWIAGLGSWRKKQYNEAARYFEVAAESPYSSGWMSAAAAYWAARSHMRQGDFTTISHWLEIASKHPRSFYGILATRALGRDFNFNWDIPTFTADYFSLLSSNPAGRRAIALVAAGQSHLAEAELVRIDISANPDLEKALLAYAVFADLPALALRLGSLLSNPDTKHFIDAALYPVSPWRPGGEPFKVDKALIHAIMRQESKFDPYALSSSGARGLMQILPSTADIVEGGDGDGIHKLLKYKLQSPEVNLALGQDYLETLLNEPFVKGDIIRMLVAYNAGPGNLQRWQKSNIDEDADPLLFIEMVPIAETRAYVERVLSSYWIYQMREGLETVTLDAVVQGQWPEYNKENSALNVN